MLVADRGRELGERGPGCTSCLTATSAVGWTRSSAASDIVDEGMRPRADRDGPAHGCTCRACRQADGRRWQIRRPSKAGTMWPGGSSERKDRRSRRSVWRFVRMARRGRQPFDQRERVRDGVSGSGAACSARRRRSGNRARESRREAFGRHLAEVARIGDVAEAEAERRRRAVDHHERQRRDRIRRARRSTTGSPMAIRRSIEDRRVRSFLRRRLGSNSRSGS